MVRKLVLRRRTSGAVKRDFRMYIRRYTSPREKSEYGYPHSNALLQFCLKLECYKLQSAACHPWKCDIMNDIKLFPTVYSRIFCGKFLTFYNQISRYKSKCIRIKVSYHLPIHCYTTIKFNCDFLSSITLRDFGNKRFFNLQLTKPCVMQGSRSPIHNAKKYMYIFSRRSPSLFHIINNTEHIVTYLQFHRIIEYNNASFSPFPHSTLR